ncbi:hypothetical protein B4135_0246 [Caldibacillus debilis]|uniref:Uncharacterized protein n=1 Tax=Caldibacillus debilis TaxID=301148 RepID=A0A150M9G6_9BACI|nr:hypothetical protein B4135_0246 [Caldibacillus debilis]
MEAFIVKTIWNFLRKDKMTKAESKHAISKICAKSVAPE